MIEARFNQIEDDKRSIQQRSRVMLAATIITPDGHSSAYFRIAEVEPTMSA